ncbi:hypothetical protein [Spirillospora sp. NPDC029432]|uniref:hypothetical protein n=1 Tax=Spirillospora sp. NPDC029432 TaxID=3154599 RepID=UPI0034524D0E
MLPTGPAAGSDLASDVAPSCAAIITTCGFLVALWVFAREMRRTEVRLRGEREEVERRLREEYAQVRDRQGRDLLIDQLRRVGDLYAEYLAADEAGAIGRRALALQRLRVHLPAVPGRYCSLLKLRFDIGQGAESEREVARRFARHDRLPSPDRVSPDWIYEEFTQNIRELMGPIDLPRPRRDPPGESLIGDLLRGLGRSRRSRPSQNVP